MKAITYLFCLFTLLMFTSCEPEEAAPETILHEVNMGNNLAKDINHIIEVVIEKPSPCHQVKTVEQTTSGTTVNYNIVLENTAEVCVTVIAEETVPVEFRPTTAGEYTLNFSVNGRLLRTRKVTVVE